MDFDTKIKVVLREDLEMWQKLNVTAFLHKISFLAAISITSAIFFWTLTR